MTCSGGCHCGAIRFEVSGTPQHVALCHCRDCRRNAGAPLVAWAAFGEDELTITQGEPQTFNSSGSAIRSFCSTCGTGLFYRNAEYLPGIVDIQSATFDDPDIFPAGAHIQTAERIGWTSKMHELPQYERFPG
jgi:hypothetical protein